jgi:hypothetical protein
VHGPPTSRPSIPATPTKPREPRSTWGTCWLRRVRSRVHGSPTSGPSIPATPTPPRRPRSAGGSCWLRRVRSRVHGSPTSGPSIPGTRWPRKPHGEVSMVSAEPVTSAMGHGPPCKRRCWPPGIDRGRVASTRLRHRMVAAVTIARFGSLGHGSGRSTIRDFVPQPRLTGRDTSPSDPPIQHRYTATPAHTASLDRPPTHLSTSAASVQPWGRRYFPSRGSWRRCPSSVSSSDPSAPHVIKSAQTGDEYWG